MDPHSTDTIELELSREELEALSRVEPRRRNLGSRRALLLMCVGVITASVATYGYLARASVRAPEINTHASAPIPVAAPAPVAVAPQDPPVRFVNPFDKSEVFEFPPGTSKHEAREAVAQILLERATDRRQGDRKLRSRPGRGASG